MAGEPKQWPKYVTIRELLAHALSVLGEIDERRLDGMGEYHLNAVGELLLAAHRTADEAGTYLKAHETKEH